jgi:hypothetical protein
VRANDAVDRDHERDRREQCQYARQQAESEESADVAPIGPGLEHQPPVELRCGVRPAVGADTIAGDRCLRRLARVWFADDDEAVAAPDYLIGGFLVAGQEYEPGRLGPRSRVLPCCEPEDAGAVLVLAFAAEVVVAETVSLELVDPFVDAPEQMSVSPGRTLVPMTFDVLRSVHQAGVLVAERGKNVSQASTLPRPCDTRRWTERARQMPAGAGRAW